MLAGCLRFFFTRPFTNYNNRLSAPISQFSFSFPNVFLRNSTCVVSQSLLLPLRLNNLPLSAIPLYSASTE